MAKITKRKIDEGNYQYTVEWNADSGIVTHEVVVPADISEAAPHASIKTIEGWLLDFATHEEERIRSQTD